MTQSDKEFCERFCTHENFLMICEALQQYADPESYFAISVLADRPAGWFADDFSTISWTLDNGDVLWERACPGELARATIRRMISDDNSAGNEDGV